jgi:hypothetical protein
LLILTVNSSPKMNNMSILKDQHDVYDSFTAEIVAQIHLADIKIQKKCDLWEEHIGLMMPGKRFFLSASEK